MPNHLDSQFTSLLIVVFLAFTVPVILSRFKKVQLPIVVGEILAGILIGRSGFGWITPDDQILNFIAEFGFVFLMFLSGMEIDFSSMGFLSRNGGKNTSQRWNPLTLAATSFGLTLIMAGVISLGLVRLGLARNPWLMGLILSTTSLGVVVPVLKEKGIIGNKFGQSVLFAALIADFVTMFLITVLVAVLSHGLTLNILLVGLLFVAFFGALRFGRFFNRLPGARRTFEELSHATAQIKIRSAFAIMLAFVVLSEFLGTEIILGAFLAGACVAILMTPDDKPISNQLESIGYGFLIPIFFIKVGIDFNISALFSSSRAILLVPLLIVAAIAVKVLPALIFRLRYSLRESLSAGALLSARLSLIIAAAAVGLRLGVISDATNAAILLVAIITVTLSPLAFSLLMPPSDQKVQPPVVIIGAGEFGLQVAEQLRSHQEQVIILDSEDSRVERARQRGYQALKANLDSGDVKLDEIMKEVKTLVCTLSDVDQSYRICQVARMNYGIPHVVAQVPSPGDRIRFEQMGVSATNAALDHVALLTMLVRNPAIYALLTRTNDNKEIFQVVVENQSCVNKSLHQLALPGDILILSIQRNGDLLIPHGNTQIEHGDHLTLMSSLEWVTVGCQLFSGNSYQD
jgi:Kef-type K+ transport system membrane component KefB/Trk K+ transport system NAD-binding subunit